MAILGNIDQANFHAMVMVMALSKTSFPFLMLETNNAGAPLYQQLYAAIRRMILGGELPPGFRLPATRPLAKQLGVSRITVVNAYEQLLAEGYLTGRTGAGTFVATELPDNLLQTANSKNAPPATLTRPATLRLAPFGRFLAALDVQALRLQMVSSFLPFENGAPAVDEFPFDIWFRIAAQILRNPRREMLGYGDPQGYGPLREAIADHLKSARGVACTADQVIITAGAQQAMDLTARIFLTPKDAVWVEDPRYPDASRIFAAAGAKIVPVPVDQEGFHLAAALKRGLGAKLVYVTPSHQYPLGYTMSLPRRLALLEWAVASNAWIVEDDYNSEFRYAGRPLASLQGLDRSGRVIYIGTFSKTIYPSLRIGCLVAPPALVGVFTAARALANTHSSLIDQAILAEFMIAGHYARHVRRMRALYEKRQRIFVHECEKHLRDWLKVSPADAGRHLLGWLPEGVNDQLVAQRVREEGVKLTAVSSLSARPPARGGLVMGYTAFDEKQIKQGVKKLREVFLGLHF